MAAFHGDPKLQELVRKIAALAGAAVETGTFHGDSALFMGTLFSRLWTIEIREDFWKHARERFRANGANITAFLGPSQVYLGRMLDEAFALSPSVFVFLDAHWQDDWPLAEELRILSSKREAGRKIALVVDDFQVPGRPDLYGTAGGGGTPGDPIYGPRLRPDPTPCDWTTFGGELKGFAEYWVPSYPGPQAGYLVASDMELGLGEGFSRFEPP